MYEVKLEYDCYGHIGECTEWWKKSYYIEVLEKGYFWHKQTKINVAII